MEKYSFLTAGRKIWNGKISVACLGYCILSTLLFSPACPPVYMRVIGDSMPRGCKGQRTFGICIIRCPLVSTLQLSALYGRGQMLAFLTAQLASNQPIFQTFSLQGCVHELRIFWIFLIFAVLQLQKIWGQWHKFAPDGKRDGTTQWISSIEICSSTKLLNWTKLEGKAALESKHAIKMASPLTFLVLIINTV